MSDEYGKGPEAEVSFGAKSLKYVLMYVIYMIMADASLLIGVALYEFAIILPILIVAGLALSISGIKVENKKRTVRRLAVGTVLLNLAAQAAAFAFLVKSHTALRYADDGFVFNASMVIIIMLLLPAFLLNVTAGGATPKEQADRFRLSLLMLAATHIVNWLIVALIVFILWG